MRGICVVVKQELSHKEKLLIYQSVEIPTLTNGHDLWIVTERIHIFNQPK